MMSQSPCFSPHEQPAKTSYPHRSGCGLVVTGIVAVIVLYRLIPKPIRRLWSFGDSTSHLALARFRAGEVTGWAAVRLFCWYAVPSMNGAWRSGQGWDDHTGIRADDGFGFSWRGFTGAAAPEAPKPGELNWNR